MATTHTTRHDQFVGPRTTRLLAALLLLVGGVAAVGGTAYAVDGARHAAGSITVPVSLAVDEAAGTGGAPVAVQVPDVALPDGTHLSAVDGGLTLVDDTGGAGGWTGFLARGDAAVTGLALGACAVLLAPVLGSVAAGEPFRRGNAARIAWTAAAVLTVGTVAPLLPQLAGLAVLDRLGLAEAGSGFVLGVGFDLAPVGIAALLLVVAEAFRRGTQIAADTEGLV
jgi:hypothetical protein